MRVKSEVVRLSRDGRGRVDTTPHRILINKAGVYINGCGHAKLYVYFGSSEPATFRSVAPPAGCSFAVILESNRHLRRKAINI